MNIGILDLGLGNVNSVRNSLFRLGVEATPVQKPKQFSTDALIIPGVGSASYFMNRLEKKGFKNLLIEKANSGTKIIGICLGLQILARYSEEDGGVEGLGLLDGYVERLNVGQSHNGWKPFEFDKKELKNIPTHQLTRKRKMKGRVFYNHEYGFVNESQSYDQKIPDNLKRYSSMVIKGNIIGIQFHPEKSQISGLKLFSMII